MRTLIKHGVDISKGQEEHVWLASDPHFDHERIIEYCNRPFKNVSEMNARLLLEWNTQIAHDDLVIFLGDLSFGHMREWIQRLNGLWIFIRGNHDKGLGPNPKGLSSIIKVADVVFLTFVSGGYGDAWLLTHRKETIERIGWKGTAIHGHSHQHVPMICGNRVNLSMDVTNFSPVRLDRLIDLMADYAVLDQLEEAY